MFETIALSLLERVLGQYVEGIDRNSLKLAVWKGHIKLERLTLRREAFYSFGLPVDVQAGCAALACAPAVPCARSPRPRARAVTSSRLRCTCRGTGSALSRSADLAREMGIGRHMHAARPVRRTPRR